MEKITKIARESSTESGAEHEGDEYDEDHGTNLNIHEHSSVPPTTPILSPHPPFTTTVEIPTSDSRQDTASPAKSPTEKLDGDGLLGWIANNGFLNRVAEKAKNSMDTMITTLDPGMKEYLYSGGDVNILIASDKECKIAPVREAFIDVFGRATVKGIASQSTSIANQPVGAESALRSASERISNIRINHQYDVPQNQVMLAIESFVTEVTPDRLV